MNGCHLAGTANESLTRSSDSSSNRCGGRRWRPSSGVTKNGESSGRTLVLVDDGGLGDGDAQLLQLTDDAQVAQRGFCRARRTIRSTVSWAGSDGRAAGEGRFIGRRTRARCQQRIVSGGTRKDAHRSRGTRRAKALTSAMRPGEAGTGDPALEHGQLMAQHEDLGVLSHAVHPVDADCLGDATEEAVEEGEGHRWRASLNSSCLVKPTSK